MSRAAVRIYCETALTGGVVGNAAVFRDAGQQDSYKFQLGGAIGGIGGAGVIAPNRRRCGVFFFPGLFPPVVELVCKPMQLLPARFWEKQDKTVLPLTAD